MKDSKYWRVPAVLVNLVLLVSTFIAFAFREWDGHEFISYVEPAHTLLHGHGLQTYQYSPSIATRSYAYTGFIAAPVWLIGKLPSRIADSIYDTVWSVTPIPFGGATSREYFTIRFSLCIVAFLCYNFFLRSIRKHLSPRLAMITGIVLAVCPGMISFVGSVQPAALAMVWTMVVFGLLFAQTRCRDYLAIWAAADIIVIVYPPMGIFFAPFFLVLIARHGVMAVVHIFVSLSSSLSATVAFDSYMYGKLVVPPYNSFMRNSFMVNALRANLTFSGASMYGEALVMYAHIILPLFLLGAILLGRHYRGIRNNISIALLGIVSPLMLSAALVLYPLKERRFVAPLLVPICFVAAMALDHIWNASDSGITVLVNSDKDAARKKTDDDGRGEDRGAPTTGRCCGRFLVIGLLLSACGLTAANTAAKYILYDRGRWMAWSYMSGIHPKPRAENFICLGKVFNQPFWIHPFLSSCRPLRRPFVRNQWASLVAILEAR
eukprot:GHVU01032322.1.p1 GENE.GHVU01032322.1~~GHVU01032322.1.p1  ORF type:complete len:492 (-),score=8.94 GHVU01032322.1:3420-4895(-)